MRFFFFKFMSTKASKKSKAYDGGEKSKGKRNTVPGDFKLRCSVNHHPMDDDRTMAHSPSHSISSASTQSSLHTLHQHEARGIFRTLEPVWSYLPDRQDQWSLLAPDNQRELENAYNANKAKCTLSLSMKNAPATAIAHFTSPLALPVTSSSKKKRPVTQYFTPPMFPQQMKSSPDLTVRPHNHHHNSAPPMPSASAHLLELHMHQNLRRALVPYWWFEQDNDQGGKGMCRFDDKNQVRLEALSEGRSTLTLTDAAFPAPFQVILEHANRSLKEECCGFMYLNPTIQLHYPSPSPKDTLHHPVIMEDDQEDDFFHDAFLNRRCSI
ncbi:hypothetical protein [Absidia glauca]|uniref:WWE domain-containing protein n=1 Tax=Absidia glauca TaxID=4829 RepID=A0A168MN83_ABSGL|nr:hypothetical protein [Absidia glauca]